MKRVLFMALAIMVAVAFSAVATGQKVQPDPDTTADREVLDIDTVSVEAKVERPSRQDEEILKRFGINFVYEDMLRVGQIEKLNLLFATGEAPDVLISGGHRIPDMKRWGAEGYLLPIGDYMDKLPNYQKLWGKDEWDFVYAGAKSSDGKLYLLSPKYNEITGYAFIYRKGTFDKMGLSFPKTTDELYTTLKTIKAADPDSVPYPTRFGVHWLMAGFELAYRTSHRWLMDSDSNELVYGPVTDNFRDTLEYVNKLYKEKLVEQEFPTATSQQWKEKYAQGLTYIQYSYAGRAAWANDTMVSVDPDAGWVVMNDMLTAYPGKEQMISRYGYGVPTWGSCINVDCPQDKVDRLLELFDWSCTEEGQIFYSFGIEGEMFEYKDGKPVIMEHMLTYKNPDGKPFVDFGYSDVSVGLLIAPYDYDLQKWGSVYYDLNKAVMSKPYIKDIFAWELSKDQEKELADLESVITDIWKEYATKFIMGKLDPTNDAHWNEYLTTINKAALTRAMQIRQEVIKKSAIY